MSLSAFYNNIKSFGQGITSIFSGGSEAISYPNGKGVKLATQDINARLWNQNPGYAFRIVKAGNGFLSPVSDFPLQINPQALDQDETFSDTITPTQTGIIVEHEGFVLKRIGLAGTTGVHPRRGQEGIRSTGQPYSGTGKSGYQHYLEFINWIRSYKQYKRDASAKDLRMIFLNYKDNEEWFVEVTRFGGKRQSPQSTLYNYNIEMMVLGKAVPPEPTGDGIFDALAKFDKIVDEIVNGIDTAISTVRSFSDLGKNLEDALNDTFIRPLEKVRDSFTAIGQVGTDIVNNSFPRKFYENILNETLSIRDNAADLFGFGSSDYDNVSGRTNTTPIGSVPPASDERTNTTPSGSTPIHLTLTVPETWPEDVPYPPENTIYTGTISKDSLALSSSNVSPTSNQVSFMSALYSIESSLYKILSNDEFFIESYDNKIADAEENTFQNQIDLLNPTNVEEFVIGPETTLEQLAIEKVGDASAWIDLKVLNNLEYPYIATKEQIEAMTGETEPVDIEEDGSINNINLKKTLKPRVLRPGDKILIPIFGSTGSNRQNQLNYFRSSFLDSKTVNLSYQELMMGIDLKLNKDRDIIINNRNDADLIVGYTNALQSIMTKLGVEKGAYKLAPEFGFGIVPGSNPIFAANILRQAVKDAIKQDPRYEDVDIISLERSGVTYILNLRVMLINDNQPVPLSVPISG